MGKTMNQALTVSKKKNLMHSFGLLLGRFFGYDNHDRILPGSHKERICCEELSGLESAKLDELVLSLVHDLDRKTPKFLKYLTESCPSCMDLPDDCPYVDYSIQNVRQASKKIRVYPRYIQARVIDNLEKINPELGYHLRERLLE